MDFKKHRLSDERSGGANRRIESFQMTDLTNAAQFLCNANQFIGVGQRGGEGFFNQDVNAGFHQGAGGFEMADRGHSDRCSLDFAVRSGELLDGTESAATEFASNGISPRRVCIDDPYQPHGFALLRQSVIDAGVVVAEGAHADHGYVNKVVGSQILILSEAEAD
jgi:hypothetical protein